MSKMCNFNIDNSTLDINKSVYSSSSESGISTQCKVSTRVNHPERDVI